MSNDALERSRSNAVRNTPGRQVAGGGALRMSAPLRFGPFRLDVDDMRLWKDGTLLSVQPSVFDLIRYFAERPGKLISRDELLRDVWKGTHVSDQTLSQAVRRARVALGGDPEAWIRTEPRLGYRFATEAMHASKPHLSPVADTLPAARGGPRLDRSALVQQVVDRLASPGAVVVVFGAAGMGKSWIVGEVCAQRSPPAVHLVGGEAHSGPLVDRLAAAAGVAAGAEAANGLALALPPDGWVVIDDADGLGAALAEVVAALPPTLRWLVAARERLALPRGVVVPVTRPSVAEGVAWLTALSVARGMTPPPAAELARLVDALDGAPLALELAAAQLDVWGVDGLLAMSERELLGLTTGSAGELPSMRAAVARSWQLAPEDCREVVCRLAALAGPMPTAVAADALGLSPAALRRAVDRSLVDVPTPGTLAIQRVIRAYAMEVAPARVAAAVADHGAWFGQRGRARFERALVDPAYDPVGTVAFPDEERVAAERAPDPEDAAGALLGLAAWLVERGPLPELVRIADALLRRGGHTPETRLRLQWVRARASRPEVGVPMLRAVVDDACRAGDLLLAGLAALASMAMRRREPEPVSRGDAQLIDALPPVWQGAVHLERSVVAWSQGRYDDARGAATTALAALRAGGQTQRIPLALANLGLIEGCLGQRTDAEDHLREALASAEGIGQRRTVGMVEGYLGDLAFDCGRPEDAVRWCAQAIETHRSVGNERFLRLEQASLVDALVACGRVAEASAVGREVLPRLDRPGDEALRARLVALLGSAAASSVAGTGTGGASPD